MLKFFRLFSLFILLSVPVLIVAHFVIVNPNGIAQFLYPVEARLASLNSQCSKGSPKWLNGVLDYIVKNQGSLSNQLAYISPDQSVYHCESGWKGSVFFSEKVTRYTRFRFASVSKVFTADAVLKLVGSGKLQLDSRLTDVVGLSREPEDPRVSRISVSHLLNHSAGFDRTSMLGDPMFTIGEKSWCPDNIDELASKRLSFDPGEKTSYSNLGYCLLGLLVANASGMEFRDFLMSNYNFGDSALQFVEGPYTHDEVRYDFRFSEFYGESYYRNFDFEGLSSSAGISGNASVLAEEVRKMLNRSPMSIIDEKGVGICDHSKLRGCYGFGLYQYVESRKKFKVFIQGGHLPGNTTVLIVDEYGGVFVWLGAGQASAGFSQYSQTISLIYEALEQSYINSGLE